jgi:regulator of ribonuclease activity A
MTDSTCDLSDEYGDLARTVAPVFRHFGQKRRFSGAAATIKCFEDNSRVKETVATPGAGRILVVDGGGSLRCALLGDMLASAALANGWAGVVIHGCVRDVAALATLDLGVMALAPHPRRSRKNGDGERDVAIDLAGTRCAPGDTLYADEDGIILIESSAILGRA